MSSIARSKSLRKPATGDSGPNSQTDSGLETRRNVSPSKLPVKGMLGGSATSSVPSTARARAASTAVKNGDVASATAKARSRPISGVFGLGRSASVRQSPASSNAATSSSAVSRPPITSRSRPTPRPTSASEPSPLPSRPTTSSGVPSTSSRPAGAGHARTRSTATTLTGTTTLRPPSQTSSNKPTAPANTAERTTRSAALTSRLTHTRTSSTSSTSASTSTAIAPRKRPVAPSEDASPLSSTKPVPSTRLPPKPAFSTLQQHYSPAKSLAPKPLTSTFLAPPSPSKLPSNIAISAETARLQTELLQLHLLRRDADTVCSAWRESARQQLGERFHALAVTDKEISAMESAAVERGNVAALTRWAGDQLEERTRLLDVVLSTVWAWNDTGGKYARVVRRFERWAEEAEVIIEARGRELRPGEEIVFVSDLDASWRGDCEPLRRKLEEWSGVLRHDLRLEGGRVVESSLERILGGLKALIDDMLSELALMVEIEREAIRQEDDWVRAMNRSDDGGGNDTRAGAIWRVL